MLPKGTKARKRAVAVGWAVAIACLLTVGLYIHRILTHELAVMLCVDGVPLCRVEDQTVVDKALLLLEEKRNQSGIRDDADLNLSYRYVLTKETAVDAAACMELLYERSFSRYARAYMIAVQGLEIATCATYAEAVKVVEDFRAYIVKQVMASEVEADLVKLITEFEIRNVFCRSDRIVAGDDVYRAMVGSVGRYDPENGSRPADGRVNAAGSLSLLYVDKNTDFGLIRNPVAAPDLEDSFSFNMSGLNSAIEYHTVVVETYSEIIGYETEYVESDELHVGQSSVVFEGENGISENVYEIAYADGVEVSRTLVSYKVLVAPKNRVERIGTREYPSTLPSGSFAWPLSGFEITSYWGSYRPGLDSKGSYHLGMDLGGPKLGEPILAADGGEVIFAGDRGSYGLMVKIQHEEGVMTYYAHMSKLCVKEGDRVYKGQKIGEIGRTGTATGVHLHFEVRIGGKTVDPLNYLPKLK